MSTPFGTLVLPWEIPGVHWCSFPHSDCQYISYRLWHIPIYRHKKMWFSLCMIYRHGCVNTGFFSNFPGGLFIENWGNPNKTPLVSYQNAPSFYGKPCSPTNCGCCLRVTKTGAVLGEDWWCFPASNMGRNSQEIWDIVDIQAIYMVDAFRN